MIYRIKQFLWAISSVLKEMDYEYVDSLLSEKEINLFKSLKKSEQNHCINVSKDCIKLAKEKGFVSSSELREFGRLGLLHDIGKLDYPINIFTKFVLVVGKKVSNNKMAKFDNIKAIDIYYNHGERAFKFLNEKEYNREFVEAIKRHHYETKANVFFNILKMADDNN